MLFSDSIILFIQKITWYQRYRLQVVFIGLYPIIGSVESVLLSLKDDFGDQIYAFWDLQGRVKEDTSLGQEVGLFAGTQLQVDPLMAGMCEPMTNALWMTPQCQSAFRVEEGTPSTG